MRLNRMHRLRQPFFVVQVIPEPLRELIAIASFQPKLWNRRPLPKDLTG